MLGFASFTDNGLIVKQKREIALVQTTEIFLQVVCTRT